MIPVPYVLAFVLAAIIVKISLSALKIAIPYPVCLSCGTRYCPSAVCVCHCHCHSFCYHSILPLPLPLAAWQPGSPVFLHSRVQYFASGTVVPTSSIVVVSCSLWNDFNSNLSLFPLPLPPPPTTHTVLSWYW